MQITMIALSLLSLAAVGWSDDLCGPVECGLLCEGGEECVEDVQVNCIMEPCCPRWSCQPGLQHGLESGHNWPNPPDCLEERPTLNSECFTEKEGAECDYGEQECCGEIYPVIHMQCNEGTWIGYYIDTLCGLGLAPPCPDDTAI